MRYKNLIGPQIRKLRYGKGWSQNTLATKLQLIGWDVGRATIAKIESRLIWVGDYQIFFFTRVLGVGILDLFPPINPNDPKIFSTITQLINLRF